jgi:hypothetical protein
MLDKLLLLIDIWHFATAVFVCWIVKEKGPVAS